MAAKRSKIAGLLAFQAIVLVILSLVVAGWAYIVKERQHYQVDLPQDAIAEARTHAHTAVITPFLFLAEELPQYVEQMDAGTEWEVGEDPLEIARADHGDIINKAVNDCANALGTVARHMPVTEEEVDRATQALVRLEEASRYVLLSESENEAQNGPVEGLLIARQNVDRSIRALEGIVETKASQFHQQARTVLLGIWAAMLIVTFTASFVARRRAVDIETNERGMVQKGVERASRALTLMEARERLPEFVDHPDLTALNTNVQRISARLHHYMDFKDTVVQNENFLSNLVEQLSVCEREAHIIEAIQRATMHAYSESRFQYLRFDKQAREVVLEVKENEPVCVLRQATDCPAGRQMRALHNHSGAGVSRCPLIKAEDKCISCAPIIVHGEVSAITQVIGYDEEITGFIEFESMALAASSRMGVIYSGKEEMVQSNTDELTGLPNNRLVNERLNELDALELSYGILVADLDHFRTLNDEYGREEGDACLTRFGKVLMRACRDSDMACRIAGETFVVLLPSANMRACLAVSMRIRSYLNEANQGQETSFTVSIGVATKPDHGLGAQSVVRAAHTAMQKAKEAGRNQVIPANIPEEQDRI